MEKESLVEKAKKALSEENFTGLKGYLAIMVLVHHLYQFSGILNGTYIGYLFLLLGRWAVILFIFMTGYGLYTSYQAKGEEYIRYFPKKRILTHYITYLFFLILYLLYFWYIGEKLTWMQVVSSLTIGGTLISFGWYLQVALVLYIAFYIAFRFFHDKVARSVVLGGILALYICFSFATGVVYYIPVLMLLFVMGVLFAIHRETILKWLVKHNCSVCVISFLLFALLSMVYMSKELPGIELAEWIVEYVVGILAGIAEVFFAFSFMILVNGKAGFLIHNPVSRFLGQRSLEIYALQGLVLGMLFRLEGNRYLLSVAALVLTLAASCLVWPIIQKIKGGIARVS